MKKQALRKTRIIIILMVFLLTCIIGLTDTLAQNNNPAMVNDGLMAYYPFDGNANDASGHGFHATPCNNFQYENGIVGASIAVVGEGHCVNTGGHVLLPEFDFDVSSGITLSLWVKALGLSNEEGETYINLGTDVFFEKDYHSERLNILQMPTTISFNYRETEISIPFLDSYMGTWVMYTLTCSSDGTMRAYVNSELVGEADVDYDGQMNASLAALGRHWWEFYDGMSTSTRFIGSFDEVRIYNRAITSQEVLSLYSNHHNEGPLSGLFTINGDGDQVYFSKGNLQYQASTNTWRFAENQWDFVGNDYVGTVYENGEKCNNELISSSYSGWIDLFGCGTGSNPVLHSMVAADYENLVDWGINMTDTSTNSLVWRTFSPEEWVFLTEERNNAEQLIGTATVNNVVGYVLLPDYWELPAGVAFQSGAHGWANNVYSISQWEEMESAGAVFLPATGYRNGTQCVEYQSDGHYWSLGYEHWWYNDNAYFMQTMDAFSGRAVRLVNPASGTTSYAINAVSNPAYGGTVTGVGYYEPNTTCTLTATANTGYDFVNWTENNEVISTNATITFTVTHSRNLMANFTPQGGVPTGAINGLFTVNEDGDQVYFSQGNLQYQASTNTWRFAKNQWDYIGYDNENISPFYNGWIDLLGWGTSGWNSGNTYYHPWDSDNTNNTLYGPQGLHNLNGDYAKADWGVFNAISNGGNQANLWRILTHEEWSYVLYNRNTSSGIRFAKAIVNDVIGIVLLPDEWSDSYYELNNTNQNGSSFSSNVFTLSQWIIMEQHGAVFLPAAGGRNGTWVGFAGFFGHYWTGEYYDNENAWFVDFYDDSSLYGNTTLNVDAHIARSDGCSVRLVRSAHDFAIGEQAMNDYFAYVRNGEIIVCGADETATMRIIDITGRVVLSRGATHRVSTDKLPAGIYILQLVNGNNIKTQKIVVGF